MVKIIGVCVALTSVFLVGCVTTEPAYVGTPVVTTGYATPVDVDYPTVGTSSYYYPASYGVPTAYPNDFYFGTGLGPTNTGYYGANSWGWW